MASKFFAKSLTLPVVLEYVNSRYFKTTFIQELLLAKENSQLINNFGLELAIEAGLVPIITDILNVRKVRALHAATYKAKTQACYKFLKMAYKKNYIAVVNTLFAHKAFPMNATSFIKNCGNPMLKIGFPKNDRSTITLLYKYPKVAFNRTQFESKQSFLLKAKCYCKHEEKILFTVKNAKSRQLATKHYTHCLKVNYQKRHGYIIDLLLHARDTDTFSNLCDNYFLHLDPTQPQLLLLQYPQAQQGTYNCWHKTATFNQNNFEKETKWLHMPIEKGADT